MDGLQPITPAGRTPAHAPAAPHAAAHALAPQQGVVGSHWTRQAHHAAKGTADYARALKRRALLVLAVGVGLAVPGAAYFARKPLVYRAEADILITAQKYDPILMGLVSSQLAVKTSESEAEIPNKVAELRGKTLAEKVMSDPGLAVVGGDVSDDPAQELLDALKVVQVGKTNYYHVTLEGVDPARTATMLRVLLTTFKNGAGDDLRGKMETVKEQVRSGLRKQKTELEDIDKALAEILVNSKTIGPGGKLIPQTQYEGLDLAILQKSARLDDLKLKVIAEKNGGTAQPMLDGATLSRLAQLRQDRKLYQGRLKSLKGIARNFDADPAARNYADKLADVESDIAEMNASARSGWTDPSELLTQSLAADIEASRRAAGGLLKQVHESMPEHQRFLGLLDDRKDKLERIGALEARLGEFEIMANSQNEPVRIPDTIVEPTAPIGPKKGIFITLWTLVSFGVGVGLVCLLENLDHTVKFPEQLTHGLSLPLLGVVPRMRRAARIERGGHLWTQSAPDSIEADAYRSLRAGLLGVGVRLGKVVSLMVTSAKAGEGKSTTALNLAATCARAGERTLLVEVDLRRPSLGAVFGAEAGEVGLVDVLNGDLPWQRVVMRTELPYLDYIPAGDGAAVPIELLGSREMAQLVVSLAGHYDRVILDAPAVLGLADCRMLGRIVDAAILVVRSGSQELLPILRAKTMLEQSHVRIAGVVFNGIFEDFENWSSYGMGASDLSNALDPRAAAVLARPDAELNSEAGRRADASAAAVV